MFLEAEPGAGVTPGNLGPDGAWPAPVRAAQGAGIWFPPNPVSQGWWQLGLGHIFKGGTTTRMSCRTRKALELAPRRKSSLSLRRPSRTSSEPADPTGGVPSRRRKVSERSRGPASSRGTARLRGAGRGPYSPAPTGWRVGALLRISKASGGLTREAWTRCVSSTAPRGRQVPHWAPGA